MNWFICVCIMLLALGVNSEPRHRHRHRHRHYYQQYNTELFKNDLANVDKLMEEFENDMNTLTDGLTIREDVVELTKKNVTFPKSEDLAEILRSQHNLLTDTPVSSKIRKSMEAKVLDSITRTLSFYNSQIDDIKQGDSSLSLKILKDIDDKHGKVFQNNFSLDQLIESNCENAKVFDSSEEIFCMSLVRQWKIHSGRTSSSNMKYWKPASLLRTYLNQMSDKTLSNIGNEKEGLWTQLNAGCQQAAVLRCEIPYICERTLLDPHPRSQYLLTHQLLQRLFIDNADCPNLRSFVTKEDTYTKLCAKAYVEAQYLDLLGVPVTQRDLFAELVGFCGYLGYTNFLREDWLDKILSWQSKSESGCFIEGPLYPVGMLSTDMGINRRATKMEVEQGVEVTNEKCLPHLTTVSLMTLTAYWDYLMDLKSHQLKEGDRLEL